ncbi:cytoplasmic protein [Cryptococcus deuterogattii CA1014]|nr:cytoplasmic protein [Cryptococcus deuterogattii CA1014]
MATEFRRIALADPHALSPPRFLVGGQLSHTGSGDVKLYEWDRENGRMSMLGLQTEIGQLKALAWSPSSAHKHLVAAGLSTGRTLLLNLAPSTLSLPVAHPPASPPVVATLPVKHARAVTSISFSPHDANYLATGLDRHRYDSSLLIWDIHDAVAASRLPPDDGDSHPYTRPELRLPTTAPLTKTSGPAEPRPIQVYCPSEQVHSVAFIPTAPYTLLSSAANKVIRLYDLRAPSSTSKEPNAAGSLAQWSTRTVMSLCPNPSSSLFASYESNQGNSTVRLWDTRYPGQEVVGWEVRGGIVGMSWVDSMRLGVGSKEGGVAVWDIVRCKPDQPGVNEWVTLGDMRQIVKPKPNMHSFAFTPPTPPKHVAVMYVLKDGTISIGPISTAPVLASNSHGGVSISEPELSFIDPDIPLRSSSALTTSPAADFALGLDVAGGATAGHGDRPAAAPAPAQGGGEAIYARNKFQLPPDRVSTILNEHSRLRSFSFGAASTIRPSSSPPPPPPHSAAASAPPTKHHHIPDTLTQSSLARDRWHDDDPTGVINDRDEITGGYEGWRRVLGGDVGVVMRRRAMEGYGLDNLLLNAAIATKYRGKYKLAGVWEFVEHLTKTMSPPISSSGGYNLTHQGIYPIWTSLGTLDAASASGGPISAALNADEDGPDGEGGGGGGGGGGLISELEERLKSMSIRAGSTGRGSRSASASVSRRGSGTHTPRERKVSERTPHPRAHPHAHAHAHANTSHHSGHSASTYPQGPPSYLPAISHLLASRQSFPDKSIHPSELRPSISSSSEKVELRKLILTICGESKEGGKGDVEEMLRRGERSKAAFRAFFRGDESGTVGILMSSEGFMSQSASARGSEYFNTHWPNLIRRVDDPYVRAILSRIAGEDWESVLEEEYIPLLERMVVGVQYLDDWEFSSFLKGRMSRFARSSSLHMLPLTGLSPPALSLLSRYLARTGDLQTVTLLAAFFPPGKLDQAEKKMVERWREGYRDMLDSWGMWGERYCIRNMLCETHKDRQSMTVIAQGM